MEYLMESGAWGQAPLLENAKNLAHEQAPQTRALYPSSLFSASSDHNSLNMFSVPLPHFAHPKGLPRPLPTKEEIESSKDVLKDRGNSKVVGVGPHFVVKYGKINPTEGENMLFVQQNTSVPVPRVYAVYTDISDGKTYIVMERVTGDSLDCVWPEMSDAEKFVVSAKLRLSMDQLRRLPSPGCYCSLGNRGLLDVFFQNRIGDSMNMLSTEGRFDRESELNTAMVRNHLSYAGLPEKTSYFERVFPKIFRDHPPTFTHGDFQMKNIVVRKLESLDGRRVEDPEVLIIDWEFSGWYPSYWEYARAVCARHKYESDWDLWIPKILDEYLVELAWMACLQTDL